MHRTRNCIRLPVATTQHRYFSHHKSGKSNIDTKALVWGKHITPCVKRIQARVIENVHELQKFSESSDVWVHTIKSLTAIASVPSAKLIRPQLVLLGYAGGKGKEEVLVEPNEGVEMFAAAVELQHLFMLIHDDVMDHGTIRRGVPTVNAELLRFGLSHQVVTNAVTVLGDIMHARALGMLVAGASKVRQTSPPELASIVISSRTAILESSYCAGLGQFQDILGWPGLQDQLADAASSAKFIEEFLYLKGANHTFIAPVIAGLRLAGVDNPALEVKVQSWGRHAGLALQGLDDILDIAGDPITTGKDTSQDIREGRISLPLVIMHGLCSPSEWRDITNMMGCVVGLGERRTWFALVRKYDLYRRCMEWVTNQIDAAEKDQKGFDTHPILRDGCANFIAGLRKHAREVEELF